MVYGDLPNRIIAYIIDIIVLAILAGIGVAIVLGIVGFIVLIAGTGRLRRHWVGHDHRDLVGLAISARLLRYSPNQRATIGMKPSASDRQRPDGATFGMNEAVKRWLALGAAFSIAQLSPLPLIGIIRSPRSAGHLPAVTTWKSPTKQGWHDVFANTMIVKATRRRLTLSPADSP